MAYGFRAGDRSVQRAMRRIAREQIDGALAAIAEKHSAEATHEVRKACKKIRALIRLMLPAFADYELENVAFRAIAGGLSESRDAKVMLDTFDLLTRDMAATNGTADLRAYLASDLEHSLQGEAGRTALIQAHAELEAARKRIDRWVLQGRDWEVIGTGLRRILRRARTAWHTVSVDRTAGRYHELRKLMKYHWYHTRLLAPIWPAMMRARSEELAKLADLLGAHHDISVLEGRVGGSSPHGERREAAVALLDAAARRRATLEEDIAVLAARLLAQKPRLLDREWARLWRIWHIRKQGN